VAFEGNNLWNERWEIAILLLWGVVVYAIAVKVFKWEWTTRSKRWVGFATHTHSLMAHV